MTENAEEADLRGEGRRTGCTNWKICTVCKGEGTVDTQGVVTPGDFSEEEWQSYLDGRYRSGCGACSGTGKVRAEEPDPIVKPGRYGQPCVYEDEADASEHLLRMAEGLA